MKRTYVISIPLAATLAVASFSFALGQEKSGMAQNIDITKTPKAIDQIFKNNEGNLVVRRGIYELDGDTLKLAFDKERPRELKSAPDSGLNITIYRREKK